MSEYSGLFDATEGSPNYDSADMGRFYNLLSTDVTPNYENELEVTIGSGLQVVVDSGGMVSKGRFYIQDEATSGGSPLTLSLDPAGTGYLRKDRIVIEFNTEAPIAIAKVIKGTDVTSNPTAPELVNTSTVWQESIAIANVSASTLTSVDDDRTILGVRVNIPLATETTAGAIEIADTAEATAGTDDTKAITPEKLKTVLNTKITISNVAPTSGDGSDGDVWFEY